MKLRDSTLYRRLWPTNRVQRLDAMKGEAKGLGLKVVVRNAGKRFLPIFLVYLVDGSGAILAFDSDLEAIAAQITARRA